MRQKILNHKTSKYEWVDMGASHIGNGISDFHRHRRILKMRTESIAISCENLEKKFSKMSDYKKQKYFQKANRKLY